jgi:hypothetical protein
LFVKLLLNAPSEVADLEHVFFSHQKILRFEVSVNKSVLVQKVDSSNCLNKEVKGFVFG